MKGILLKKLTITATVTLTAMAIMFGGGKTLAAYAADAPERVSYDVNGDGETSTDEKAYALKNADDLYWFANEVKIKDNCINAYLTGNITVNENLLSNLITIDDDGIATVNENKTVREWIPVGTTTLAGIWTPDGTNTEYKGTFNGAGYTIFGLYYSGEFMWSGLFGNINGGTIKNVNVSDSYISGIDYTTGGVCGINNGTIENCNFSGEVRGESRVGGVCGENNGTIENCNFSGKVRGEFDVGGVCGENNGTIENCNFSGEVRSEFDDVGGVCGANGDNATIKNCYNTGAVNGNSERGGGVCGYNTGTIEKCYNTGAVNGNSQTGGVCGYNTGTVEKCYNEGDVNGNSQTGGVCGENFDNATIKNCYNEGDVNGNSQTGGVCGKNFYNNATIKNCYNTGDVNENFAKGDGVCASSSTDCKVTNCYFLKADGLAGVTSDYGTAKIDEQFASGEVCWLLNGGENQVEEPAFFQNLSGEKDALPVLDNTHSNVYYSNFCKVYSNKQHKIVPKEKVNETCTTTGHAAYWQCEGCGKAFSNEDCTIDINKP